MFSLIFKLGLNAMGFNKTLDDSKAKVARTSQEMGAAFRGGFAGAIGKVGALLGGIVTVAQVKNLVEFASGFQDMSERTGVAVETLQELDYALKQAGSSAQQAEKVFIKLQQARQAAVANPKGKEAQQFGAIGIAQTELQKMKDGGELFMRLGDAIEQTKLNANSLPVILDLIGAKNAEVLPAMAAGLRSSAMEARRLNLILSGDTIEALDALGDEIEVVTSAIKKPFAEIVLFFARAIDATIQAVRFLGTSLMGAFGEIQQHNPFLSKEDKQFWKDAGKIAADDFFQGFNEFLDRNDPEKLAQARAAKKERAAKKRDFNLDALIAGAEIVEPLTEQEWNARPAGVASAAFHVRHMAGVIDRLFTYARGHALSTEQLAAIQSEGQELLTGNVAPVLAALSARVDAAVAELRTIDVTTLGDFRGVGRAQLPSTVIGCLVHGAEHAMRHVGQLSVTARVVRSGLR